MESRVYYKSSQNMEEVEDESVQLVVTSPPYYLSKSYGQSENNIENAETREEYEKKLKEVLEECFRVLKPDGKLCLNVVNPYTKKENAGRLKRIPFKEKLILWLEEIGLDYMEEVRWLKKRFGNSGTVFGSYPYPTNFYFSASYESILVFRKWVNEDYYSKRQPLPDKEVKEKSKLSKEEWKEMTNPTWKFDGVDKNDDHPAKFPYELPYRCIRMFTFVGDTVLDPFVGSGTTLEAALDNNRNAIGYEIEEDYKEVIQEKISNE